LAVALIANVAAGMLFSPMTSIVRAHVVGAEPWDQGRISALMTSLEDVPYERVSPRLEESLVLAAPEVQDAVFSRNIFGRSELRVTYRQPVAKIVGFAHLCLSDDGVLYPSRQTLPVLPQADLPDGVENPSLTFAVEPPLAALSQICAQLPSQMDKSQTVALYNPDRGLCLNVGSSSSMVVLGSADRLDEKLQGLSRLLQQNPDLLQQNSMVNLMAPGSPAVVRRTSAKSVN